MQTEAPYTYDAGRNLLSETITDGNGVQLDDTLDTRACIEACEKAFKTANPIILNSDQGCQFTSTTMEH